MSSYHYFNIQIKPAGGKKDFSPEEYKRFFVKLKNKVNLLLEKHELHTYSHRLKRSVMFLSLFKIKTHQDFATGKFIKYDRPDSLKDIYSNEKVADIPEGNSTRNHYLRFLFNYKKHTLAIEDTNGKLPATPSMVLALKDLLWEVLKKDGHNLEVFDITEEDSNDKIFDTKNHVESYSKIDVNFSYSNSGDLDDILEDDIKENNAGENHLIQKAPDRGAMTGVTKIARSFIKLANKYGDATIDYISKEGERLKYEMREHPVVISVKRRLRSETVEEYWNRVNSSVFNAQDRSYRKDK